MDLKSFKDVQERYWQGNLSYEEVLEMQEFIESLPFWKAVKVSRTYEAHTINMMAGMIRRERQRNEREE